VIKEGRREEDMCVCVCECVCVCVCIIYIGRKTTGNSEALD
jgi:hypothetical protein